MKNDVYLSLFVELISLDLWLLCDLFLVFLFNNLIEELSYKLSVPINSFIYNVVLFIIWFF